jgi:hypothetical protein
MVNRKHKVFSVRVGIGYRASNPDVLRRRMEEAGLKDVYVETESERLAFRSGTEMWYWVINSNPIAVEMITNLTEDQRARIRSSLDVVLHDRRDGNDVGVLKSAVHICVGTK